MAITYSDPQAGSTSEGRPADLENHDLVVLCKETKPVSTVHGESIAAVVTIYDATAEEVIYDVLWFSKVLVAVCGRSVNSPVIGRLGKAATAKPGMSKAWVLNPIEDEKAKAKAIAFAEANGLEDEINANNTQTSAAASSGAAGAKQKTTNADDEVPF